MRKVSSAKVIGDYHEGAPHGTLKDLFRSERTHSENIDCEGLLS